MDPTGRQEGDMLNQATRALRETPVPEGLPTGELERLLTACMAVVREVSQGDDSTIARDPTQPVVRLVPDVPTDRADGVQRGTRPIVEPPSRRHVRWRFVAMFQKRSVRWIAAAAAVVVILGGVSLLSPSSRPGSSENRWWLGPPSVWAAEINAALAKSGIKGVTCRERTLFVQADGSTGMSSTWDRFYVSHDSYRRDIYDGDFFREIQWYVPDQNGLTTHTSVRFDTKSYFMPRPGTGSFGHHDPVERVRFYVNLLDKADRLLGKETVDGHECVGFEIRASKYGSNPDTWLDKIWFDVNTRLPVRMEQVGRTFTGITSMTRTTIQDQFDYSPDLSPDTFVPAIPNGFIKAHPDELLKKPKESAKGQ